MKNQDIIQASYHMEELIKILSDQIETGQEFTIVGNFPFANLQLADMGISQIPATQEYTHAYLNERTWVCFKTHFQETHLDRE